MNAYYEWLMRMRGGQPDGYQPQAPAQPYGPVMGGNTPALPYMGANAFAGMGTGGNTPALPFDAPQMSGNTPPLRQGAAWGNPRRSPRMTGWGHGLTRVR